MDPQQQAQQQAQQQQQQQQSGAPPQHPQMHDESLVAHHQPYQFYAEEDASYTIGYPPQMSPYGQVVHPGPPRSLSTTDLQHAPFQFRGMPVNLMSAHHPHQPQLSYNPQPIYGQTSPQHVPLPLTIGSPPASPSLYDPLSPPVSGSDTSGEGIYHSHSRTSSGAASPVSSSRRNSLVHRNSVRYNPTPSPSSSSGGRRSRARSLSDDDGMGGTIVESIASTRKEATRKQRIEAEQRRRDELRDGYAKLKDVLPVSNSKSSKVSLLERATKHIIDLERRNDQMQDQLTNLESEVRRLRSLNEKISLSVGVPPLGDNSPSPGSGMGGPQTPSAMPMSIPAVDVRPLSPPPEGNQHSLTTVSGQEAPREDSSGSDGSF